MASEKMFTTNKYVLCTFNCALEAVALHKALSMETAVYIFSVHPLLVKSITFSSIDLNGTF